jgi:hypothetical protein
MAPNAIPQSELYCATIVLVDHALSPAERARLRNYLATHYDLHGYRERRFEQCSETDQAVLLERESELQRHSTSGCLPSAPERNG